MKRLLSCALLLATVAQVTSATKPPPRPWHWEALNPPSPGPGYVLDSHFVPTALIDGVYYAVFLDVYGGYAPSVYRRDPVSGAWSTVCTASLTGWTAQINALFVRGNDLYIGGYFDLVTFSGIQVYANNLVKFSTSTGLATIVGDNTLVKAVQAVTMDSIGNLYVGNNFNPGNLGFGDCDPSLLRVLRQGQSSWQGVASGLQVGYPQLWCGGGVFALGTDGTSIFIGGSLGSGCFGPPSPNFVGWDGANWHPMHTGWTLTGNENTDYYGIVRSTATLGGGPFIAGFDSSNHALIYHFDTYGNIVVADSYRGGDLTSADAITTLNGSVYVGGKLPGGVLQYASGAWLPAGGGLSLSTGTAEVRGLAADSTGIYAIGDFDHAGCLPGNGLARLVPGDDICSSQTAWWPFDGNLVDIVGLHPTTAISGAQYYFPTPGRLGPACIHFNGTGGLTVTDASGLGPGPGQGMSIDCWVDTGSGVVVGNWGSTTPDWPMGYELYLRFTYDGPGQPAYRPGFAARSGGGVMVDSYASACPNLTNGWHHLAVVLDPGCSLGTLYADGSPVLTFSPPSEGYWLGGGSQFLTIGTGNGSPTGNPNFVGFIDELTFYGRALTPSEVLANSRGLKPCPECISLDPAAWWRFEGNPIDTISGVRGALSGSYGFVSGEVGQALNLTANPAGMTFSNSDSLNPGSGDFSIEGWVQPRNVTTPFWDIMDLVDKRQIQNVNYAKGYVVCLSGGKLAFQMSDSLTTLPPSWVSPAPDLRKDGLWHHVAVTVARSSTTGGNMYVDGSVVYTFDPTIRPGDLGNTYPLLMGLFPTTGYDANYRGLLDEMSIYKRVLSASEIQEIYLVGSNGKCTPLVP